MADEIVDVGLDVEGDAVFSALSSINKQIGEMQSSITKIVKDAGSGAEGVDKLLQGTVKGLQQAISQMQTIAKGFNTPNANIQFTLAQKQLSASANAATAFARSLAGASTAAEALQGKINDIDRATAAMAKAGPSNAGSAQTLAANEARTALEGQLKQLQALDKEYDNLNRKAARGPQVPGALDQAQTNRQLAGSLVQAKALEPDSDITNELALLTRANDEYAAAIQNVRNQRAEELREAKASAAAEEKYWDQVREAAVKAAQAEADAAAQRDLEINKGAAISSTPKAGLTTQQQIDAAYAQNEAAQRKVTDAAAAKKASDMEKGFGAIEAPEVPATDYNADADAFAAAQQKKVQASYDANQKIVADTVVAAAKQAEANEKAIATQTAGANKLLVPVNAADSLKQLGYDEAITKAKADQAAAVRALQKAVEDENAAAIAAGRQQLEIANANVAAVNKQNKANNPIAPSEGGGLGSDLANAAKQTLVYSTLYGGLADVETAFKDSIAYAIQFQDTLDTVKAVTDATDGQMQALKATIYDVGTTSKYTTQELATAAVTLAQAGESVMGVQQGLAAASNLGAATGATLVESVDAITGALNTFNLQEEEQAHIGDVISEAANKTKLTMTQLTQGFQTAGVAANEQGVSFEELTATLGVLATAGTKSRTAGTGLAALLSELEAPSLKLSDAVKKLGLSYDDISVKEHGLSEVLNTLRTAGFGTGEAFEAMNASAARTFLTLSANPDAINNLQTQLNTTGASALSASLATQSFGAVWTQFKNQIGGQIQNSSVGSAIGEWATQELIASNNAAKLASALKPVYDAQQAIIEQLGEVPDDKTPQNIENIAKLNQAYADQEAQIAIITQAYGDEAQAQALLNDSLDKEITASNEATNASNQHAQAQATLSDAITQVYSRQDTLKTSSSALSAETSTLISRFAGLSEYINTSANSYDSLTLALRRYQAQQAQQGAFAATAAAGAATQAGRASANVALQTAGIIQNSPSLYGPEIESLVKELVNHPGAGDSATLLNRLTNAVNNLPKNIQDAVRGTVSTFTGGFAGARAAAGVRDQQTNLASADLYAGSTAGQNFQQEAQAAGGAKVTDAQRKSLINKYQTLMGQSADKGVQLFFESLITEVNKELDPVAGFKDHKPKKTPASRVPKIQQGLDNTELTNANNNLSEVEKETANPQTLDDYSAGIARVNAALQTWIAAETKSVAQKIANSKGITPAQVAEAQAALAQSIQQKTADTLKKTNDEFFKYFANAQKVIEEAFKAGQEQISSKNNIAAAQVTSLTRLDVKDRTPDYVTANVARSAQATNEQGSRDTIALNATKINADTALLVQLQTHLDALDASNKLSDPNDALSGSNQEAISQTTQQITTLKDTITSTTDANKALVASFQGASLLPQSFGEALQGAAVAYRNAHQMNNSFSDDIKNDLGGAINEVGGDFDTFFVSIAQGTATISQAFGTMVTAVLKYLEKLAAQMAAKAIFGQILSLVGSSLGSKTAASDGGSGVSGIQDDDSSANDGNFNGGAIGHYNGGRIGYDSGGRVTNGSETHDSVDTRLAKGEWVIKKKSVDAVGNKFMANLNANGAAALAATQAVPQVSVTGPKQETNVWVVKPDAVPPLGKNDVLAAVQDDILKGGETKKLIQYVSNGN